MNMSRVERPFGVTFIAILVFVVGIIDVIGGITALTHSGDDDLLGAIGTSDTDVTTFGVVMITLGVIVMLTAAALRRGANWSRMLIVTVAILRVAVLIWSVATYHRVHWYDAVGPTVIYGLVTWFLLFSEDARRYFEGQ